MYICVLNIHYLCLTILLAYGRKKVIESKTALFYDNVLQYTETSMK